MKTIGLNGAEALLRVLRQMGVECIFASPGSEWSALWEALARPWGPDEIPRYISSRHEETAVAMAMGYAKATGKLPAVVIHTTVGSLHATMALRGALHERLPMVVLAGESVAFGEDLSPDPGHQWLSVLADTGGPARLMESCVKWSFGLNSGAILPHTIQRACQVATASPQGPVFVSVPWEYTFEKMINDPPAGTGLPQAAVAAPGALDDLAKLLASASKPAIVTEYVGRSPRAVDHLVRLAESLGAPVYDAWRLGYVNFPRKHPLYGGVGASAKFPEMLQQFDALLLLDTISPWHPPTKAPAPNAKVGVLGEDPVCARLPYWGYRTDLVVTGSVEPSLAGLADRVERLVPAGSRRAAVERWGDHHEKARAAQRAQTAPPDAPIDTKLVASEIDALLADDVIVVDETISHRVESLRTMERLRPGQYFQSGWGGLGVGLGVALGVKQARPDATVICTIGDGTLNYNPVLASFGAVQEHGLPMLVVVFDNAGYLSQKSGVPLYFPQGDAVRTNHFAGTSITPAPDYAAIARAFDGYGERVTARSEVGPALRRGLEAVKRGKLALVDMVLAPTNKP